jgi:hypothetical protein
LGIGVGQPTTNIVQVTDEGLESIQAKWNGGPVHSLTGIQATVVQTQRSRNNQITFTLNSSRTGPTAVAVGLQVPTKAVLANEDGPPLRALRSRTSGSAVQSGSVLTVTVIKRTTNTVEISNSGGGAVAVEWNGGSAHSFTGIATIVVDTEHARKNLVALDDVTPRSSLT